MHILAAIIGFLGIALFWWYRLKDAGKVAGEVASKLGTIRGNIRREALRKKAGMSPITAIDNPLIAAATLLYSNQSEVTKLGKNEEETIAVILRSIGDQESLQEAIIYARWAVTQIDDTSMVIDKLGKFLRTRLNNEEKYEMLEMLEEANRSIAGSNNFPRSKIRLAGKMGIEIAH